MEDTTPSTEIKLMQVRLWYQKPAIWIGIGAAACLTLLAMPHVMRVYHRWTGKRALQRATAAYAKGSYQEAFIDARAALACDARDVEATRIFAKTAEAMGLPQAVDIRRQVDALQPGDAENLLSLAEDCLKTGDSAAAAEALKGVKEADRNSARYHDVAGAVAAGNNRLPEAEAEWKQAAQLDPKNDDYRLKLARVQLSRGGSGVRTGALTVLEELKGKAPQRLTALRILVGDALTHGEVERGRSLATELAADPQATFGDKLIELAALKTEKQREFSSLSGSDSRVDPRLFAVLAETQKEAVKPEQIHQLVRWMTDNNLALMVPEWIAKLPKETVENPHVSMTVADAYARILDWKAVKESVEKGSWQQADFLRFGLLARALDRLGDGAGSRTAWNKAMELAQTKPAFLEVLYKELPRWSWEAKGEEVLLQLSKTDRCPRWVLDTMWRNALRKEDTQELFRISKSLLKADPKGFSSRNNYIVLGLLSGQDPKALTPLAEALARENPQNPTGISTYSLALYEQGRIDEAIATMEKLTPEQRHAPSFALYYGVFLASAGQAEQADEYLHLGQDAVQLPEEKMLADFFRLIVKARLANKAGDEKEFAASWTQAFATAQTNPDWLETLGKRALDWKWQSQAEAVALKVAETDRCPRWAAEPLWSGVLKTGNPTQIYKIGKLISSSDSTNLSARINFVLAGLLGDRDGDAPEKMADTLARENPTNAAALLPQAYSLLEQGKADDAVALFSKLKPEELQEPRVALYRGFALAAAGQMAPAAEALDLGATGIYFPEEKPLFEMTRLGMQTRRLDESGNSPAADDVWKSAIGLVEKRPTWLEMLGRLAVKSGSAPRAEQVLWKLADNSNCPAWALDYLTASAEKNQDASQLYRLKKLKYRMDPKNRQARESFILLSLLTGHDEDTPHRLAEALAQDFPAVGEVAIVYGLSLHQRGREKEAVAVFAALPPAQQREPRTAFYYGLVLAAAGENTKAEEYLRLGADAPLLPEEKALLTKAKLQAKADLPR